MSARAVIIGLLCAVFVGAAGYFNFHVVRLNQFAGNFLPIIVFFPLVVAVALVNPLLRLFGGRKAFSRGELAVVVAVVMMGCAIPGSSLLRMFSRNCVMPIKITQQRVDLKKARVLDYVPSYLLANDGKYDAAFIEDTVRGMGLPGEPIGFDQVPWGKWVRPLTAWMPVIILFVTASICLGLMVHRTWVESERLPYPIAQLAGALIENDADGGSIFRRRYFLVGMCVIFGIHVINGVNTWSHGSFIQIPLEYNFPQIAESLPEIQKVPWGTSICRVRIWPAFVAIACLAASDVSFSLGILPFLWLAVAYWLVMSGARVEWIATKGGVIPWQTAGSFIGLGMMLIYLGRRHFMLLLGRAMGLSVGRRGDINTYEVWACRIFIVCMAALVAFLNGMGLSWSVAALLVLLVMLGFLVFARINVESGLFLIQAPWQPLAVMLGLFGAEALGLHAIAMVGVLSVVVCSDRRECLMPFFLNSLRVSNLGRISLGRVSGLGVAVFVMALAVAVPVGLWVDHNYGLANGEWWSTWAFPAHPLNLVAQEYTSLSNEGVLRRSADMSDMQRLANMKPDYRCLVAMGFGVGVVLLLYRLRLRYTWWPLHPIALLVWGTWAMHEFSYSFLIGWLVKTSSLRLGVRYSALRVFMIGVLVGDLCGGALWMIVGAIYWAVTGQSPPRYHIYPGG